MVPSPHFPLASPMGTEQDSEAGEEPVYHCARMSQAGEHEWVQHLPLLPERQFKSDDLPGMSVAV